MRSLANLFAKGEKLVYKKRDIITSPSIPLKGIYYLEQGFIYSYSINKSNKKMVQTILKPGDIFPLLQHIQPNTVSSHFYVEALTKITLSFLDKDSFFAQVYADKILTKELMQAFANYLSKYIERVENLERETLSERVVGRLLHFASDFGTKKEETIFIQVPLTHEFIAESINVSRENVSRELSKLEKEKLIAFQEKHLVIVNIKKLRERILC